MDLLPTKSKIQTQSTSIVFAMGEAKEKFKRKVIKY